MTEPPHGFAVDLTNCGREPIHIPGAIQPHGVLFALSLPTLTITQVSENVGGHLRLDIEEVLERPLDHVLDPASAREVAAALIDHCWNEMNPLRVTARGERYDGIVHEHEGIGILELEPAPQDTSSSREPLRPALSAIQQSRTPEELSETTVREVKRLTGFERVMLYRFDDDGHGCVDAEAKEPSLDPYLGLRYPASDIPQQARALYLKNWLRIIPDARYTPARILPALRPDTGAPLDLSFSALRSVSPIHLEYLANMGVRASMSVSLIVQDRLWGLISCANHTGPRLIPYDLRSAVEVLGRLLSLQLDALAASHAAALRLGRRGTQEMLATTVRGRGDDEDVLASLLSRPDELLRLAGADGAAAVLGMDVIPCGRAPSPALIQAIASWLDDSVGWAPYATSELPKLFLPALEAKDVASGVLTFALPGRPRRRLLWFRPEIIRTVSWGGDPRRPAEADAAMRLHPRRSFEQWKEEVRLSARPWAPSDIEAAEELRRNLVEIDLERQVAREQRAVRARDDVVAVVSHDLRNPLGVIQMQSTLLMRAAEALPAEDAPRRVQAGSERIQRAAERMNALIRDLLDLAKIEADRFELQRRPEPIVEIIEEALLIVGPMADAKRITVREELLDQGAVHADRERIFQVLSNLLGNAVKFTPEGGAITLRVERLQEDVLFTVADTGPGIPAEQLAHIFDRYWQVRRTGQHGTGLGLYIAKGVVEAHGGRIWAESPPGAGARFFFTLPPA